MSNNTYRILCLVVLTLQGIAAIVTQSTVLFSVFGIIALLTMTGFIVIDAIERY
jgi:hypothetical protein